MSWFFLSVLYFLIAVGLNKCLSFVMRALPSLAMFVGVGAVMGLLLCCKLFAMYGVGVEALAGILLYAAICEFYIIVMTMVMSSIGVSILTRLQHISMSLDDIASYYSEGEMVEKRFSRLLSERLIEKTGEGGYRITRKGRFLHRILCFLRGWFHGAE